MSTAPKRVGSSAIVVLVTCAMMFVAFALMTQHTSGAVTTSGTALPSGMVRETTAPAAACGQTSVALGSAGTYAALSGTTVTNTGPSALTGDLGVSPGSAITGFPPGTFTGTKNVANPASAGAEANLTTAYNDAAGRSNCAVTVAGNIGGQTLTPGLYKSTSSLAISSGDLTLSGGGNPNGIFVFQVASALTTTSGRTVILSNGAQAGNIFWQVGSSATIGTTSTLQGTILARASISMLSGSHLNGRALARSGDVTLSDTTIVVPTVTSTPTYAVTFTESGLPSGTSWSVTFGGNPNSSTTTTTGFTVVSGTYPYSVDVAGYIANPASGSVTVSGGPASQAVAFTVGASGTFTVTFTESGLASGSNWSVTFHGATTGSATATIDFSVPSGSYTYTVGVVSNYTASPTTGSVVVNGAAMGQSISFSSQAGGGGGGGSSSGTPTWVWAVIAVVVVGAIVGGIAVWMLRKK